MKKLFTILMVVVLINSCKNDKQVDVVHEDNRLALGQYRGVLNIQDDEEIPFIIHVKSDDLFEVYNAEEVIEVTDIDYRNDSIYIQLPAFEGYLATKIVDGNLEGSFIKESLDRVVPFKTSKEKVDRFSIDEEANHNVAGSWQTVFSKGQDDDEYIAKGVFKQQGSKVTGTFRTTTGDYRYLDGVMDGDQMKLSAFDGAHAFLFTAKVTDTTMQGFFYSGNHHKEPFEAVRNESYELPSANELTYLNEGYDTLAFSFPDLEGNMVSLNDERFKDKVVLVQIMGSWCPNCLDESKYYTGYYNQERPQNVEIIALAFEYAKTEEKALNSLKRLRENVGIEYPILLAQYGTSDKKEAQKKLPMLNHVLSYPTTVFIDKKGKVRKIHTGFNGPATAGKFTEFKKEFTEFVKLLAEE